MEAVRSGTPVLASRVPGNVGMLGADYEGYFPHGDAAALAALLLRCRAGQASLRMTPRRRLLARLARTMRAARARCSTPRRERAALLQLLAGTAEPVMNAPSNLSTATAAEPRLTSLSHGGGCGCKIAPGVLSEILKGTARMPLPPELLVGIETADDAAVYQLNDEQALIATTDFFMPIVDDPFDFGRIAATNAISDVYAMGGKPIMALALVGMPISVLSHGDHRAHPRGRRIGVPRSGHPDRRRPHHRFGRADLWPGCARAGAPQARQAQRRCASRATCWCWASRWAWACCPQR